MVFACGCANHCRGRTMSGDLEDRIAELEDRARRFVLATTGTEGWHNYFQQLLLEEREFFNGVISELVAQFHREILNEVKAMLDQALATRVCGTFKSGTSYARGDVVALDGGSFLARRDNPGPCPGPGWQMIARQGQRGIAGPKGDHGPPGKD